MRFAGVIDSLVSFAIIKRCKVLFLHFIDTGDHNLKQGYIVPAILYRSIYLTQLTLGACDVTSCDEVWLRSLKLLHFREVVMSDEAMDKFLLGCPSLVELSLYWCYGLRNMCCRNIKLKNLEIVHLDDGLITLSNLNVVSLNIDGWIGHVEVLKSTVADASVCCSIIFRCDARSYKGMRFLFQLLDQCDTFRLCERMVMVIAIWELTNIFCPNFNWKQLVLNLCLTNCVQAGLSTLLRHVPLLETLKINVQPPRSTGLYRFEEANWRAAYNLDEDKCWNEEEGVSLENLKIVVIHGCIAESGVVIRLAKFLLRNAVALEKMVISANKNVNLNDPFYAFTFGGMGPEKDLLLTNELSCILENLSTSPKASTKSLICFI